MSQDSLDIDRNAPEGDISLGRELRRAREVRGISVQQIAQETKINERYIHALENDRLDLLPGQPYTSNFVRSIARTIGADEEELIDYLNYHLRVMHPEQPDVTRPGAPPPRPRPGLPLLLVVGAVLVIIAITIALRNSDQGSHPREPRATAASVAPTAPPPTVATLAPETGATGATGPAPASATVARPAVLGTLVTAPVASAATAPETPTAAAAPPTVAAGASAADQGPAPTVKLVWRSRAWVDTYQEGDPDPRVGMKNEGDEMTWTLDRPLALTIGNAGKVDLYIDGQLAKPLGAENETRRISLDRRNWKSFLR